MRPRGRDTGWGIMDFGLSQEQVLLVDTVRRYLADNCPTSRVRSVMESETGHDGGLWAGLMELGVGALVVPESYGGLGAEFLDLALISEQLGSAAVPGPFLGHAMATLALVYAEDSELKKECLSALAGGEALATCAVAEPGDVWDHAAVASTVKDGKLSGRKTLVPYASAADWLLVVARDGDGPGLWLVDAGAAGMELRTLRGNDMTRRVESAEFSAVVCRRVGGVESLAKMRDAGLVLLAADSFGGAQRCLDMARDYALQRQQFGQVIGMFQAVKHQLANLAAELEPSMSLYWYAAHAYDRIPEDGPRHAALAKAYLSDLYDRAARDSTELHGGIGFTWEFDLHLWFRRSIFNRSYLGDSDYLRGRAADLAGW